MTLEQGGGRPRGRGEAADRGGVEDTWPDWQGRKRETGSGQGRKRGTGSGQERKRGTGSGQGRKRETRRICGRKRGSGPHYD